MSIFTFTAILINTCKNAEQINNKSDFCRVKRWKNTASFLYCFFTALAILAIVIVLKDIKKFSPYFEMPEHYIYFVVPFVAIFTAWGFATMLLNFKLLIKSMFGVGADGYRTGEQIQTQNIYITHEYGDRYKVTRETENQGCAVAMISGFINLFIWCFLCIYVCPFLTFKKIITSNKNLRRFKSLHKI